MCVLVTVKCLLLCVCSTHHRVIFGSAKHSQGCQGPHLALVHLERHRTETRACQPLLGIRLFFGGVAAVLVQQSLQLSGDSSGAGKWDLYQDSGRAPLAQKPCASQGPICLVTIPYTWIKVPTIDIPNYKSRPTLESPKHGVLSVIYNSLHSNSV